MIFCHISFLWEHFNAVLPFAFTIVITEPSSFKIVTISPNKMSQLNACPDIRSPVMSCLSAIVLVLVTMDNKLYFQLGSILSKQTAVNILSFSLPNYLKVCTQIYFLQYLVFRLTQPSALRAHANYHPTQCKITPMFMSCEC